MFEGKRIMLGGQELVVPALSLGQLRNGILKKLREHDELVNSDKGYEALELRGEIILAALRRNYPDYEEAKLFDHLDLSNTSPIWMAVLGLSGLSPGETVAAGQTTTADGTLRPSTEA